MRQNGLIGRQVAGRFTIKRFLGEGGMATVFVAEQDAEPHEVALKIMNEELSADRTFVKRFQREAKAAARVQHPNSVAIIDYGVADGLSYIAMELLDGDDLYVLLERDGAISQAPRGAHPDRGLRRAHGRARARHRAPRSQAREHHGRRRRGVATRAAASA